MPQDAVGVAALIVGVDGSERYRDALTLGRFAGRARPGRPATAHVHPYGALSDLSPAMTMRDWCGRSPSPPCRQRRDAPPCHGTRHAGLVSNRSSAAASTAGGRRGRRRLSSSAHPHRSGLGRVFAGSVARVRLADSRSPLRSPAARPRWQRRRHPIVGCGFDGSPEAHEALGWAADIARPGARASRRSPSTSHRVRRRIERRGVRLSVR